MKTVYDLYHWSHPDACAEVTRGFETPEAAIEATGLTSITLVQRTSNGDGILIDPDPVTGRQTEWGIFERQEAETDSERVQLALELLIEDGQVDGQHHLRWVIDQAVRVLAGSDYERRIADYCDGEDGPETYSWDEGIAP
jgi:hypothetical protein